MEPALVPLSDQSAVIVADLLYDGLVETVGVKRQLRPALASTWQADDGFLRWDFVIDQSRGVSTDAVVNSFRELLRSEVSGSLLAILREIDSVSALDSTTVRFELKSPNAGFVWLLTGLGLSVVGPDGAPTGRYRIAETTENTTTFMSDQSELPQVEVTWADNEHDAYDLLVLGKVDAAVADPASLNDARQRFGSTFAVRSITRFYVLNRNSDTLNTSAERRRLLSAIDHERILSGESGRGLRYSDGVVPPSVVGFGGERCGVVCSYDVDFVVTADHALKIASLEQDQSSLVTDLGRQFQDAGFDVEIVQLSGRRLAQAIVNGEADIYEAGWIAPADSVDAVVPYVLAPSSPANMARIDSVKVAQLIAEAKQTADDDIRWSLYSEAHKQALAEGLILPLASAVGTLALAPQAESLAIGPDGSLDMVLTVRNR